MNDCSFGQTYIGGKTSKKVKLWYHFSICGTQEYNGTQEYYRVND